MSLVCVPNEITVQNERQWVKERAKEGEMCWQRITRMKSAGGLGGWREGEDRGEQCARD